MNLRVVLVAAAMLGASGTAAAQKVEDFSTTSTCSKESRRWRRISNRRTAMRFGIALGAAGSGSVEHVGAGKFTWAAK
jgi:hypothetical protein